MKKDHTSYSFAPQPAKYWHRNEIRLKPIFIWFQVAGWKSVLFLYQQISGMFVIPFFSTTLGKLTIWKYACSVLSFYSSVLITSVQRDPTHAFIVGQFQFLVSNHGLVCVNHIRMQLGSSSLGRLPGTGTKFWKCVLLLFLCLVSEGVTD